MPLGTSVSLRFALLTLILGCAAPPPEDAERAPARPRADINAPYLSSELDVERLAAGFASENREAFIVREAVTEALDLRQGETVADVGAGTGIYLEPFSRAVGPEGTVYAVDIAQRLLDYINAYAAREGLGNVETVLGEAGTTTLPPESLDLVFTSDVYHHFERPAEMNASLFESLRSGGRYAILDFRAGPNAAAWIKDHVRSDQATVISEVTAAGFTYQGEIPVAGLQENMLLLFTKP